MSFLNPWVLLGTLLALLGVAFSGYQYGNSTRKTVCERDSLRVENAGQKSILEFLNEARAQESADAASAYKIAEAYEKGKTDATATAQTVVAGLRDGTLQLRKQWRACESRAAVPQGADTAGKPDGDAELRISDASNLVRISASCDRQVEGLQAFIRSWKR